jgi:cytochrome c biogenesis protein CcdA
MTLDTTAPLGIACLGLLLGMRHATDPDHVVAVTTILSSERRFVAATRVGVIWGLGHTLTVLIVGASIILFKLAIPTRVGLAMEFAVAVVLILLGTGSAARLCRRLFTDSSEHLSDLNLVAEENPSNSVTEREQGGGGLVARRPLLRSFAVGLVHGLAGSAAIALVVLSAIPQPIWATVYLIIFCIGTIVGMGMITTAIGMPFMLASRRMTRVHQLLVMGSGLLSVGFGLFLAWQIGINDHLFGVTPVWVPH